MQGEKSPASILGPLENGGIYSIANDFNGADTLNIEAEITEEDGLNYRVTFDLTGPPSVSRTENHYPYMVFGDNEDCNITNICWSPWETGTYELAVGVLAGKKKKRNPVCDTVIRFTVTE